MARCYPLGDKEPRFKLAEAVLQETQEGQGPVFTDCRHLSPEEMEHLNTTLGYDKDTLPDFLAQKGVDLAKEPLEVMVAEGHLGGPVEGVGSGLVIDEGCASTLEGLFGAGDSSTASPAIATGYAAGKAATAYALRQRLGEPPGEQVAAERERVFAPLGRKEGVLPREMEEV